MDNTCLLAETLALELLARDGIAVIWHLNLEQIWVALNREC